MDDAEHQPNTASSAPDPRVWSRARDVAPGSAGADARARFAREVGRRGEWVAPDGVRLGYAIYREEPERAAVVFVPGRGETHEKYCELVHDLRGRGYSLYFLDPRGQGTSERLLGAGHPVGSPAWQRQHVDAFDDYARDVAAFVREVVLPTAPRTVLGWGHSMGAAILTRLAQLEPDALSALIVCSPMYRLPIRRRDALVVRAVVRAGRGVRYARGRGPFRPDRDRFAGNNVTTCPERFAFARWLVRDRPDLWTGGPTFGWARAALRGTAALRRDAGRVRCPVLLFQAGADRVVDNAGQDEVAVRLPAATKIVLPGARHELLHEADAIRDRVLSAVLEFLATNSR